MFTRRTFLQSAAALAATAIARPAHAQGARPNILWLSCEDISPNVGCYGDPNAKTPTLDQFAREGVRYTNAHTVAPVCAPNRSSIITGVHACTLGSQHMRAGGEGADRSLMPKLPADLKLLPQVLREGGYYCTNNSKEDYNFAKPEDVWDDSSNKAHWKNRPDGTPFFAVFNYTGTHEGTVRLPKDELAKTIARLKPEDKQDPDAITPPPFHPNTPIVREGWAQYLECITALDYWMADHLADLEAAGLADNTIVIYWSDHGMGLPRGKRWLYDSGTWVPFIVRIPEDLRPEGFTPGTTDDRLLSFLDLAPTTLHLAGMKPTPQMQGKNFLAPRGEDEWDYLFAHRDRMDERYDCFRSIRDTKYRYIRNFMYWQPYGQYLTYCEVSPIMKELRRLQAEGNLPEACRWVDLPEKPHEELFDCEADPDNMHNLAADPAYGDVLKKMRVRLHEYMVEHRDVALIPEYELNRLGKEYGARYNVIAALTKDDPDFVPALYAAALGDSSGDYSSPHASVRYWAVMNDLHGGDRAAAIKAGLGDESPVVRIPTAGIKLKDGGDDEAMRALLAEALADQDEWVRLLAAHALDEAGEKARPVEGALTAALGDRDNKYVARVANHALNTLNGTENEIQ